MKKAAIWLAALTMAAALSTTGCADKDAHSENSDGGKAAKADSTQRQRDEAVPVEVAAVHSGSISSSLLLSSNLETEEMADVYSRVQGLVEEIFAEEGDHVKKGQLLMKLEANEYELAEARARVNFEQQKKALERAEAMYNKELLSIEEFEQAKFAYEAAQIEWKQARLNLDYTRITSPISGVIGDRLHRVGDRVQPNDRLFTVINTNDMIAVVYVPEKEIRNIRRGQKAYLTSTHFPDERFSAWVKRVSPVIDPKSGTFKVTVGVRNPKDVLRPGMFVNVHIVTDTHEDAVLIPKTAIVYENEKMYVYVVRQDTARKIAITPGFEDHEKVESLKDIEAGEKVIVVGQAGMKDGTPVKVVAERPLTFAAEN